MTTNHVDNDIVEKIEQAGLVGRGGAGYSTAKKWREVAKAKGRQKYVVVNASEGEAGLFKDLHILKNHADLVLGGVVLALDYLQTKDAYINLNKKYHRLLRLNLEPRIKECNDRGYNIKYFIETPSYIGGDETALLNAIEGKRTEPRLKPPYPSISGLYGCPTLVNNVETFYNVGCVAAGIYARKRYYCLSGKLKHGGVYHLPEDWDIAQILKETNNYPNFDFFVQVGGGASGMVYDQNQLAGRPATGAGSVEVFDKRRTDPRKLVLRWLKFYQEESCGKCAPCRVGTFEVYDLAKKHKHVPWPEMFAILETMEATSFCPLGQSVIDPIRSYYKNVLKLA